MTRVTRPSNRWQVWLAVVATTAFAAHAQESMYKPMQAVPGGLVPEAVIESMQVQDDQTVITGKGLLPPFNLQVSDTMEGGSWTRILTNVTALRYFAFTNDTMGETVFYRVEGRSPNYAGAQSCKFCHDILNPGLHDNFMNTIHMKAYDNLPAFAKTSPGCIPCHTVGYGQPSGYVIGDSSQHNINLRGVQCENCHGPAADHALNPYDPSLKPAVTIAAESCGGCHTDAHHPTYDEWLEAGHAHVSEPGMFNAGVGRMHQCGTCHSGAVRQAVVKAYDHGTTPEEQVDVVAPTIEDANHFGQTCSTCHDPHIASTETMPGLELLSKPAQLRNPIGSAKFMSYATSQSPTNFAAQYDPDIQLCGQCHNERGANWTGTGRPPHHSPQYNILIGQVVDPSLDSNNWNGMPMAHGDPTMLAPAGNPAQCTACHNRFEENAATDEDPNYTGHTFEVQLKACGDCHGFEDEETGEAGVEFIQGATRSAMAKVINALNTWGATKIPNTPANAQFFKANCVPWEFSTIGQLNTGKTSPNSAAQARIPKEILQARFLLYIVEHDASYGVHNVYYVRDVLQIAKELAENAPEIPAE